MSIAVPRGQAVKFPGAGVNDHCELPVTCYRTWRASERAANAVTSLPPTVSHCANCLPFVIITSPWKTSERASSVNLHLWLLTQLVIGKFPILATEAQPQF